MTGKIFRSTLAASLTVLLASLLVITGCLYTYFGTVREQQLQTELTLAAAAVEADGADYLARVRDTAERLTWVASDGAVLYDTRTDTQPMENHGQREEIREALTGGSGRATVDSPAAITVKDGKIYATIVWSSPNYDYMIVDGEKYLPTNTEGNSTFEIPVSALDTALDVTADTVAMSTPHEIEYTLTFDSASLKAND